MHCPNGARAAERVATEERRARVEPLQAAELSVVAEAFDRMLDALARAEAGVVASERLAAIGSVTAGVAHEINNPIAVIRGYVKTMLGLLWSRDRSWWVHPRRTQARSFATGFSPEAMAAPCSYRWPGNVRELRSAVDRAAIAEDSEVIPLESSPDEVRVASPLRLKTYEPPFEDSIAPTFDG